jgi:hypothetical protein
VANHEQDVRQAALGLKQAIDGAAGAGYRINWPSNVAGLDTIAISETAAVKQPEPAEKPKPQFDDTSL